MQWGSKKKEAVSKCLSKTACMNMTCFRRNIQYYNLILKAHDVLERENERGQERGRERERK